MRSIYIALLIAVMIACGKKETETVVEQASTQKASDSTTMSSVVSYRYQLIDAPENTFGYDVYKDSALFIHQPHIPGMPGVKGFEKKEQAEKAAALMIEKMKNGIVPPTLSEEEIADIIKK